MVTVASLLQIMNKVGLLDSSRDLQPICAKSFINRLHLVLQINKILTQNFLRVELNTALFPLKLCCQITTLQLLGEASR